MGRKDERSTPSPRILLRTCSPNMASGPARNSFCHSGHSWKKIWPLVLQGNNGQTHLGRSILGELPLTGRGQHPALSINMRLHARERFYKKDWKRAFFQFHLSVSTAEHGMTFWLNCPPGKFYNLCPVTALAYQTNNKTLSQGQDWSACYAVTKGFVLLLDYWYRVIQRDCRL